MSVAIIAITTSSSTSVKAMRDGRPTGADAARTVCIRLRLKEGPTSRKAVGSAEGLGADEHATNRPW